MLHGAVVFGRGTVLSWRSDGSQGGLVGAWAASTLCVTGDFESVENWSGSNGYGFQYGSSVFALACSSALVH